jgi:hypothetical protein
MIPRYRLLQQRIRQELSELQRTQALVQRHWQSALTSAIDQDAYLNSVALNLHSFYSGLERIFELIASDIDGSKVGGGDWHTELLRQMTLDLGKLRPPVLSVEPVAQLDELRRFRHLVRNIYASNLSRGRMQLLVTDLPALWQQVKEQLEGFCGYLDEMSRADEVEGGP